jgi:mannose-6-phosphate isomerase-like protein (cupin superfamily)
MLMKRSKANTERYTWGKDCAGWHLLKTSSLSVIQELMPSGTTEQKHYHSKAQQLFFILNGRASFEVEDEVFQVDKDESFYIEPGLKHRIWNDQGEDLNFLVISEPASHEDRINCEQ